MAIILKGGSYTGGKYGAFQPPSISACTLWLDAADSNTITLNGSNVSQWNDKSGNDNHLLQGTADNQPTYDATGWTGAKPTVSYNDATEYLSTASAGFDVMDGGDVSVFFVEKLSLFNNKYMFNQFVTGESEATNLQFSFLGNTPRPAVSWEYGSGTNENIEFLSIAYNTNDTVIYTSRNTTDNVVNCIWDDGTPTVDLNRAYTNNATGGADSFFNLGGLRGGQSSTFLVAEFIVYKKLVTEAERQIVNSYLKTKWGI